MGTLLFGALLFQIKFKIVLKEYASNPRMCVAAYFMFLTLLFKMASIPFLLHNSQLFKLEHTRKGFQMRSFTFYLEGGAEKKKSPD